MTKPYDLARAVADLRTTMKRIGTAKTAADRKELEAEAQRMRDTADELRHLERDLFQCVLSDRTSRDEIG